MARGECQGPCASRHRATRPRKPRSARPSRTRGAVWHGRKGAPAARPRTASSCASGGGTRGGRWHCPCNVAPRCDRPSFRA